MSEFDTDIMVAFLPREAEWVKQDLPHLTLVYAGEIADQPSDGFTSLLADTLVISQLLPSFALLATGVEQFGEGMERVDVLRLLPSTQLLAARRIVQRWNASQYTDFKPHVTIGPVGSAQMLALPNRVYFDRVMIAWGDKHYTWFLRG